jgi:hypothetical protein
VIGWSMVLLGWVRGQDYRARGRRFKCFLTSILN